MLYAIGRQDDNLYRIDRTHASTQVIGSTGLSTTGGGLAFVIPEPAALTLAILGTICVFAGGRRTRPRT